MDSLIATIIVSGSITFWMVMIWLSCKDSPTKVECCHCCHRCTCEHETEARTSPVNHHDKDRTVEGIDGRR